MWYGSPFVPEHLRTVLPEKQSSSGAVQDPTGRAVLTGMQALTAKELRALRRNLFLTFPELDDYNFVKRAVSLQSLDNTTGPCLRALPVA